MSAASWFDEPVHRRVGNRISLLPISEFCGKAPVLSEQYGAGRAAAMSSAFHAAQAGAPDAPALASRLTDVEREEIAGWHSPATVVLHPGCTLDYQHAEKEVEVVLQEGELDIVGHVDFAWIYDDAFDGFDGRIAYVADIKKSVWTTTEGPESLQLHGYGMAYAKARGCDAYVTGLWCATEGEWLWAKEMVVLDSDRGRAILERIKFAAENRSDEASTGEHCGRCWSRMHCPEHLLPAALGETWLAPVAEGGDISLVDASFIHKLGALEKMIDVAKEQAKAAVKRGLLRVRDPETGKIWAPVETKGRVSVDAGKLKAELGDDAKRFMRQGAPYDQFRWVKA